MQAIPSDIPVILDSKRGDIDTTAQAYATSSFEIFNASAVTLSPYMGWDSVQPFVTGKFEAIYLARLLMSVNARSYSAVRIFHTTAFLYQFSQPATFVITRRVLSQQPAVCCAKLIIFHLLLRPSTTMFYSC